MVDFERKTAVYNGDVQAEDERSERNGIYAGSIWCQKKRPGPKRTSDQARHNRLTIPEDNLASVAQPRSRGPDCVWRALSQHRNLPTKISDPKVLRPSARRTLRISRRCTVVLTTMCREPAVVCAASNTKLCTIHAKTMHLDIAIGLWIRETVCVQYIARTRDHRIRASHPATGDHRSAWLKPKRVRDSFLSISGSQETSNTRNFILTRVTYVSRCYSQMVVNGRSFALRLASSPTFHNARS